MSNVHKKKLTNSLYYSNLQKNLFYGVNMQKIGLWKAFGILSFVLGVNPIHSATINVFNTNDSGTDSLREAITTANTNGDASNTINIDASLAGDTINLSSFLPLVNMNASFAQINKDFGKQPEEE